MESLVQSIRSLQQRLQKADILSVVIGGAAVALWGEPRATRDVDLSLDPLAGSRGRGKCRSPTGVHHFADL